MFRVEVSVIGDIHELLPSPAEAEFVAFGHPLGLWLTREVQEPWLGQLSSRLLSERDERVDRVRVRLHGREDHLIDGVMPRIGSAGERRRGCEVHLGVGVQWHLKTEAKLRNAYKKWDD